MRSTLLTAPLLVAALASAQPVIAPGGIASAGSYSSGPLVAGSLAVIFGSGFSSSALSSPGTPLPVTLNKVSVTMNGAAVPLYFVSPSQVNVQVPWSLAGVNQAQVVVANETGSSAAVSATLAGAAPALFTSDGKQAVVSIAATRTSRTAHPGEYIRFYATGLGPVANTPASGAAPDATLAAPLLSTATTTISDTVGGIPAVVSFAGLAPQRINAASAVFTKWMCRSRLPLPPGPPLR